MWILIAKQGGYFLKTWAHNAAFMLTRFHSSSTLQYVRSFEKVSNQMSAKQRKGKLLKL